MLSETANFMKCRGPLSDQECAQDRWEIQLNPSSNGDEGSNEGSGLEVQDPDNVGWTQARDEISEEGGVHESREDRSTQGKHWIAVDVGSSSSIVGLLLDWGPNHPFEYDVQVDRTRVVILRSYHTTWIDWCRL